MKDLISRQAAIDAVGYYSLHSGDKLLFADKPLKALPAAQPQYKLDEFCTDCKEYDKERHSCPRWNRVIRQTAEDMKAAQPHWIPVTERLPEADTWVLVTCDNDVTIMAVTVYGEWYLTDGNFTYGKIDVWMPLPEPWKGSAV